MLADKRLVQVSCRNVGIDTGYGYSGLQLSSESNQAIALVLVLLPHDT